MSSQTQSGLYGRIALTACAALVLAMIPLAAAHDHHEEDIPEGEAISLEPIDSTLWIHILLQMLAYGIIFPLGMVLGMIKSRWHVPLQVLGTAIAILAYFLGHMHKGRQFNSANVHAKFAYILNLQLFVQVLLGAYLKLHLERGFNARIRPALRLAHSINGKAFPVFSWAQMIFGGITALGFCQGDHLGQCLAHFIMGGAFIAYGIILTILLLVGQLWLRRTGRSQEFYDSCVIAAWGCVNTFTEHRWGTAWVKNDWQHTTMGVIWWCAGLAGVWMSRDRDGSPKRNFIPGFVLLMTGWAMSAHPQELMTSAMVHKTFGYTLMAAGLTRMIEVSFVLNDKFGMSKDGFETHSFQYIPAYLLFASGFLFQGATEEQMLLVAASPMDPISYILILYSLAFLLFLFVNMLISIYDKHANADILAARRRRHLQEAGAAAAGGSVRLNGSATAAASERRQVRDAEEFELDGLVSDDEDEEHAARRKLLSDERDDLDERGMASPSTLGRNSDRVAP